MTENTLLTCTRCGALMATRDATGWCSGCRLQSVLIQGADNAGGSALSLGDIPVPGAKQALIGHYELLEVIAHGGMGVVYRARQRSLNRIVAFKLLLGGIHASDDFKKRFRQEAEMAAKLNHANIVPIYEVGEHNGQPFFSMEWVPGTNLAELAREKPLAARTAALYVERLAQAIDYAHQQGVVHRDLKPSNILIGPDDRPRITDFGLAGRLDEDSSLTTSGEMLGTPGYLPPEQATMKKGAAGPRSDVYSLGALLYFLLTGRPPFLAGTLADTLHQVLHSEPVSLRRLNPAIPRDLETICLKCLEKDSARRYPTAQALAEDVGRFLSGQPILAKPATAIDRLAKWCRREPLVAALGASTLLILLVGLTTTTWLLLREHEARLAVVAEKRRADEQEKIAEAVNEFLANDILRPASPEAQADAGFAPDPNLTLREALDRAGRKIGNRFQDQPMVEAKIHAAIGEAFSGMGQPEAAIPHFERAVALVRGVYGGESQETVEILDSLAQAFQDAGRVREALPWFEQNLKLEKALLGSEHENTLILMNNLASAYREAGRVDDALQLFEEALKIKTATQGRKHPDTLTVMGNLAVAYQSAGKFDRAVELFEETLRWQQSTLGTNHPNTLSTMSNLGYACRDAGKLDRAIPLMEQVLKLQRASLGPGHFKTQRSMDGLGMIYAEAGQFDAAKNNFSELLELRRTTLGPNHCLTLQTVGRFGEFFLLQKQFAAAEPSLLLVCNTLLPEGPKLSDQSKEVLNTAGAKLIKLYEAWGRPEEAAIWRRRLQPFLSSAQ